MYALKHGEVAEVAFSNSKEWQGKGIAGIILSKLAEAARENGLLSLVAYVLPRNTGMIKLIKKLPYEITTKIENDMLILSCNFDECRAHRPQSQNAGVKSGSREGPKGDMIKPFPPRRARSSRRNHKVIYSIFVFGFFVIFVV